VRGIEKKACENGAIDIGAWRMEENEGR